VALMGQQLAERFYARFCRMGAFAENVTVPARIACSLPDSMPFAYAALIEALFIRFIQ
jgi:NADPH:quinone reductase-like Zn-dependent oxidoreductase